MGTVRRTTAAVAALCALALAGCGADSGPRPVTDAEADRVAEALFANYDGGGATFSLTMASPDGTTTRIVGDVDWRSGAGRGHVQSSGASAAVDEVAWTAAVTVEHLPALPAVAEQFSTPATAWAARTADPVSIELDSLTSLVLALGTPTRDNPELIKQRDVQWVRTDTVNDTVADVFRYGERTYLWLARDSATVVRFEGDNDEGSRPVLIDLIDHGARVIDLPGDEDVTLVSDIPDIYAIVRGSG